MTSRHTALVFCLTLTGCPKPSAPPLPSSGDWWSAQPLSAQPVSALAGLHVRGAHWSETATALGLSADQFYTGGWGEWTVQVLRGDGEPSLAIYQAPDSEAPYGFIIRGRESGVGPTGVEKLLISVAATAQHGSTWHLYTEPAYVRLVSTQKPLMELGCLSNRVEPLCHVKVFHDGLDADSFTSIPGNSDAVFERAVKVR